MSFKPYSSEHFHSGMFPSPSSLWTADIYRCYMGVITMLLFTLKKKSQSFAMETGTLSFGPSQFVQCLFTGVTNPCVCWDASGINVSGASLLPKQESATGTAVPDCFQSLWWWVKVLCLPASLLGYRRKGLATSASQTVYGCDVMVIAISHSTGLGHMILSKSCLQNNHCARCLYYSAPS